MTAFQIGADANRMYAFCPICEHTARVWTVGASVTVAQIILAEQRHLDEVHPQPVPDYDALHDGLYGNGIDHE